jgi:hypothetical protein
MEAEAEQDSFDAHPGSWSPLIRETRSLLHSHFAALAEGDDGDLTLPARAVAGAAAAAAGPDAAVALGPGAPPEGGVGRNRSAGGGRRAMSLLPLAAEAGGQPLATRSPMARRPSVPDSDSGGGSPRALGSLSDSSDTESEPGVFAPVFASGPASRRSTSSSGYGLPTSYVPPAPYHFPGAYSGGDPAAYFMHPSLPPLQRYDDDEDLRPDTSQSARADPVGHWDAAAFSAADAVFAAPDFAESAAAPAGAAAVHAGAVVAGAVLAGRRASARSAASGSRVGSARGPRGPTPDLVVLATRLGPAPAPAPASAQQAAQRTLTEVETLLDEMYDLGSARRAAAVPRAAAAAVAVGPRGSATASTTGPVPSPVSVHSGAASASNGVRGGGLAAAGGRVLRDSAAHAARFAASARRPQLVLGMPAQAPQPPREIVGGASGGSGSVPPPPPGPRPTPTKAAAALGKAMRGPVALRYGGAVASASAAAVRSFDVTGTGVTASPVKSGRPEKQR